MRIWKFISFMWKKTDKQIFAFGVIAVLLLVVFTGCMEQTVVKQEENNIQEISENQLPTAVIHAESIEGMVPLDISFIGVGEDTDGSIVNYCWDFDDGTNAHTQNASHTFTADGSYEVVFAVTDNQGATAIARLSITVNSLPADWTLTLKGAQTIILNRTDFEFYINLYGESSWEEEGNVWTGLPLWYLVAMIDDKESEEYTFNDDLADSGYTIRITAGDGWETTLKSYDIARNDGYLIVDKLNGEPLPIHTPKGKPSWPLHLRGTEVFCPNNVGNVTEIDLEGLLDDNQQTDKPVRSFLRDISQNLFPRWYRFFSDIRLYLSNLKNQ